MKIRFLFWGIVLESFWLRLAMIVAVISGAKQEIKKLWKLGYLFQGQELASVEEKLKANLSAFFRSRFAIPRLVIILIPFLTKNYRVLWMKV